MGTRGMGRVREDESTAKTAARLGGRAAGKGEFFFRVVGYSSSLIMRGSSQSGESALG
jgi:hypothetical protein